MTTVDSEMVMARPKRKCSVLATPDSTGDGHEMQSRELKSAPSVKVTDRVGKDTDKIDPNPGKLFAVVPLKVSVPEDSANCKLSDDLADSVRTLCKVCGEAVTLTGMRSHTKLVHQLQITRYKEIHGPFEIIEHIFHKCHLCGKILLLDSDAMGGHIKGTHKMKESDYKERFMNYKRGKSKNNIKSIKQAEIPRSEPVYDFKTTFPDYEYSCNLKHCELCEREGTNVVLDNNNSAVKRELKNSKVESEPNMASDNEEELVLSDEDAQVESEPNMASDNEDDLVLSDDDDAVEPTVSVCQLHGQGGWSKTFLNSDILAASQVKEVEFFHPESIDFSDDSLLEVSNESSSASSTDEDSEEELVNDSDIDENLNNSQEFKDQYCPDIQDEGKLPI